MIQPKPTFKVNVILIGVGVVPLEISGAASFDDVLSMLDAADHLDGKDQTGKRVRVFKDGMAGLSEFLSAAAAPLILGGKQH